MRLFGTLCAGAAIMIAAGCSSLSTVDPRAMTPDDVIGMTRAGVGAEVITRQIESTRSRFELTAGEIVRLKREGVTDEVITAMIDTAERDESHASEWGMSPYDFWYGYSGPLYYGFPYGGIPYGYGAPYVVYRQPGLLGRFYSYYPLTRDSGLPGDYSGRTGESGRDGPFIHPGTGLPFYPERRQPKP